VSSTWGGTYRGDGFLGKLDGEIGRMGSADELAKTAVFLASDDSRFITGIELFIDGGFAQV
jgi:NAD(P)-dependent dehydrogenase (short-subunit alcohol dehydrogenase family)